MFLRLIVGLSLALLATTAEAAFVQSAYSAPQSPTTTVTIVLPVAQTAGNLNVVAIGRNDTTSYIYSVTDSLGNAYNLAGVTVVSANMRQSIYYAKNIKGGTNKVYVTFTAAAAYPDVRVLEYSGLDPVNPVDAGTGATGTGTLANSGFITTSSAHDLLFGAAMVRTHVTGPGSGYTSRLITYPDGDNAEDREVTSTGTYNATAPMTSGEWAMNIVAFRFSGSATTTVSPTPKPSPSPSPVVSSPTPAPSPVSTSATTYNYYVSTSGSDSNSGTASSPFRTITKAIGLAKPSTTIHVLPGVYVENVNVNKSGTSTARIVLKSETKWGAKIQTTSAQGYYHIGVTGSYVDVVGFDVSGTNTSTAGIGIDIYGSYNRAFDNHVYNLVTTDCSGHGGIVGITVPWNGQTTSVRHHNEIRNNVIHDIKCTNFPIDKAGACIYIADQHNTVDNNLVFTCGSYGIESNHYTGWNTITNNTVGNARCSTGCAGIMMSVGGDSTYSIVSDYNVVANNIVVDSSAGISAWQGSPSTLGSHNVWANNLVYNNGVNLTGGNITLSAKVAVSGTITADPRFVNKIYSSGNSGNFRLTSSSPAINKGTTTYSPSFDFDYVTRPQLGAPDIGAYEYH